MSDLTQVELLWLEKRIENRIRFGRVAEERILDRRRRVLSFAPAASLRSCDGCRTILGRSFPASTSCGRSQPANAIRLSLM